MGVEQKVDQLLDSLLNFLEGDINDRFLARKKIDEQRRHFKLALNGTSFPMDSSEKKKTLKELCGISTLKSGGLDSRPIGSKGNKLAMDSRQVDHRNSSSMDKESSLKRKSVIKSSSSKNIGQNMLLDYLRICRNNTATFSDIERKVCAYCKC